MNYYLEKLEQVKKDDKQNEAYLTNDSTVVIAGPGSGKTTILTLKIMRLLNEKIKSPRGLACVTYSREAAREFKQRLNKLGYKERSNVFLGTVHSFCISEVLGNFAHLYDYGIPLPIKIISNKNKKKLFAKVVDDLGYGSTKLSMTEMDKERTLNINGLSKVEIPSYDVAMRTALEYEKRLHEMGVVDYECIIKYSTVLIQEQKYVRKCLEAKFPWIIIDEYQDLGRPLHEIILSLFTTTNIKVFAVGDPDQSIYGFSGAIPDYLNELYERKDIIPIELKTNYRSNQDIIDASEAVLQQERNYRAGTRKNEEAEFVFVTCEYEMVQQYLFCVEKIIPHYIKEGVPYEEIAILLSKNDEIQELSKHFIDYNIPYYISKHLFERTDFVKWIEACASWVCDVRNESFTEIYLFWERMKSIHKVLNFSNRKIRITEKRKLYSVLEKSRNYKSILKEWVEYLITELQINRILEDSEIYPEELDNIKKLIETLADEKYSSYNLSRFSKLGKPENQVTISTRHSSKGLEFEIVVMLGVEDGRFPNYSCVNNPSKLAEEQRICFVCVSRAKKACVLVRSKYIDTRYRVIESSESIFWKVLKNKFGEDFNETTFV